MFNQIEETCVELIKTSKTFRENLIKIISDFVY
jgi:hypothetical protein